MGHVGQVWGRCGARVGQMWGKDPGKWTGRTIALLVRISWSPAMLMAAQSTCLPYCSVCGGGGGGGYLKHILQTPVAAVGPVAHQFHRLVFLHETEKCPKM